MKDEVKITLGNAMEVPGIPGVKMARVQSVRVSGKQVFDSEIVLHFPRPGTTGAEGLIIRDGLYAFGRAENGVLWVVQEAVRRMLAARGRRPAV